MRIRLLEAVPRADDTLSRVDQSAVHVEEDSIESLGNSRHVVVSDEV